MKFMGLFMPALFAGIVMGLGGAVMLSVGAGPVAALLSGVGILAVQAFNMSLFTARTEELLRSNRDIERRIGKLCLTMLGNTVGAALVGLAFGFVSELEMQPMQVQTDTEGVFILLLRAFFGGMLLFVATHGYKRLSGGFAGCLLAVLAFATIELCGFSFALTEIFRSAATLVFSAKDTFFALLIMVGNTIGVLVTAWIHSLRRDKSDSDRY